MYFKYNSRSKNYVLNVIYEDSMDRTTKMENKNYLFSRYAQDLIERKITTKQVFNIINSIYPDFKYPVKIYEHLTDGGIHTWTSVDIIAIKLIKDGLMRKGNVVFK